MFDIYNNYYKMGLFTADDLATFVLAGFITEDQKNKILGTAATNA